MHGNRRRRRFIKRSWVSSVSRVTPTIRGRDSPRTCRSDSRTISWRRRCARNAERVTPPRPTDVMPLSRLAAQPATRPANGSLRASTTAYSTRRSWPLRGVPCVVDQRDASPGDGSCGTCHGQDRWNPSGHLNHDSHFALDGDHNAACATCHTGGDFGRYTCSACHEHAPTRSIRAKHDEEGIRNIDNCVRWPLERAEREATASALLARRESSHRIKENNDRSPPPSAR